jgi:hypothetical protein
MMTSGMFSQIRVLHMVLILFASVMLSSCGGGGGGGNTTTPTPSQVANADPTGYYDATGTASVGDGNGGTLNITDLQAMVNGNRFIAMSASQDLVYDGTITDVTQNSYTATVSIYKNGALLSSASASGTITQGSSITGTLTGTGQGNGTFNLTYALVNNQVAAISRVVNNSNELWDAQIGGSTNVASAFGFTVGNAGTMYNFYSPIDGLFIGCKVANGSINPVQDTDLYTVTITLSNCNTPSLDSDYTGLAVSLTKTTADDSLLLVVSNPNNTINAVFGRDGAF